jgi:Protein of unknown function (DUF1013)
MKRKKIERSLKLRWYCYPEGCDIGRAPIRVDLRNTVLSIVREGTAAWLVVKTSLSFDQISDYCGLDLNMVRSIADGDLDAGIEDIDPIATGELSRDEIARADRLKIICVAPRGQPQEYILESPRILDGKKRYVSLELADMKRTPAGIRAFVNRWGMPRNSEVRESEFYQMSDHLWLSLDTLQQRMVRIRSCSSVECPRSN